jgi:FlaA1/EpsC-like NDP-sugar epimerase
MITMAGLVPGEDIKIEFIGLRPGEKLREELMTEEEDRSHIVRKKIYAVNSPPPPPDLERYMTDLRRFADTSDRQGILITLKRLIPTFQSQAIGKPSPATAPMTGGKLIDFGRPL